MKHCKKFIALLLILALAFSLAGCGTVSMRAARAASYLSNLRSAAIDLDLDIAFAVTVSGQTFHLSSSADGTASFTADPSVGHLELSAESLGLAGTTDYYWQKNTDNGCTELYYSTAEGEWRKHELAEGNSKADLGVIDVLRIVIDGVKSFRLAQQDEAMDGVVTTRYEGKIDSSVFAQAFRLSGLDKIRGEIPIEASGTTPAPAGEEKPGLYADLGSIPTTLWLNNANDQLVRIDLDLTDIAGNAVERTVKTLNDSVEEKLDVQIAVESITLSLNFRDYNAIEPIVVPEAALAAELEK